jgi:AraC-like DNA-binding protein
LSSPRRPILELFAPPIYSVPIRGPEPSLRKIAKRAGASLRTLERLFRSETGLPLASWRRRMRLLHALRLLAAREPVTSVALETGYDSTSAFIAMFRQEMGTTPSRYFALSSL